MSLNKIGTVLLLVTLINASAFGRVQIIREDAENPFVSVAKSTVYGALAGIVISVAVILVASGGNGDEIFKVCFVSGTAAGLGYGLHHAATRPSPSAGRNALLQLDEAGNAKLALPVPTLRLDNTNTKNVEVSLLSARF